MSLCHHDRRGRYRLRVVRPWRLRLHARHASDCVLTDPGGECPPVGAAIGPDRACPLAAPASCDGELTGTLVGDVAVPEGAVCTVRGTLTGDVFVEGTLVVWGTIVGDVTSPVSSSANQVRLEPGAVVDGSVAVNANVVFGELVLTSETSITGSVLLESRRSLLRVDPAYCSDLDTCVGANFIGGDVICVERNCYPETAIGEVAGTFSCGSYQPSGSGR